MALLDELKKMPSFKDVEGEAELLMKARQLENQATKAEALEKANQAYKAKADAAEAAEVEAIVNKAVSDGKISKEQVNAFKALMKSDRANAEALINGMKGQKPQLRAAAYIEDHAGGSFANKSWDELDKCGLLGVLKNSDAALFAAKYKERFGVDYNN